MVKKLSFSFLIVLGVLCYSQSSYEKDLASKIAKLENAKSLEDFQSSKDDFAASIGSKEAEWKSYYYAALSLVRGELLSQRENKTQGVNGITASAEKYLSPILAREANNAEISILISQIHLLKSFETTENKFAELKKANEFLAKAELQDKNNPRIDIVKGEIALNSLSKLNGNKEVAKKHFNSALSKFKNYQRKSNLYPNWGKEDCEYYLSILK